MPPIPALAAEHRLTALDGLRGAAAVVVLLWHATLATRLGDTILGQISGWPTAPRDTVGHIVFDTPLRVLTMGTPAVTVFFVLSGVVLILPILRGRGLDLWAYYPRRLLRLWIPCAASVVLAVLLMAVVPQSSDNAASQWAKNYTFPQLDLTLGISSLFVVTGDSRYNNPLWSLKWELLFSLMLPVVALIVLLLRRWAWPGVFACAGLSGFGAAVKVEELQYAPMFLAGGLIALVVARNRATRAGTPWALVIGGILLISVPEMYRSLLGGLMSGTVGLALTGCVVLGAALLVRGLAVKSSAALVFDTRPMQFLGRISFSLYLVHVPIIMTMVNLFPGHPARSVALSIPLSLIVATVFARLVEEPSARWAKWTGGRASLVTKDLARA